MPNLELKPLTLEAQALAARVGELLKDAKPGQTVTLPPDLAQAIDDAARAAAAPAIIARRRLEWLHSRDSHNVDGYEWGIFRVKWENGRAVEVWQTNGDFSDLDAAMSRTVGVMASQPAERLPLDVDLPERVIDQLVTESGFTYNSPEEQDVYDLAQAIKREVLARIPNAWLKPTAGVKEDQRG